MGTTAAIASVAGAGLKAFGQVKAGNAESDVANYNASVADMQATDALERGEVNAAIRGRTTKKIIGASRAGMAAQNVDISSGSAADVQGDAAYLGALDVATIKNNAAREAWGYRVQAVDYRNRGRIALQTGQMRAGRTLLTAGSQILLQQYGMVGKDRLAPDQNDGSGDW
jgi:hypothetical protein